MDPDPYHLQTSNDPKRLQAIKASMMYQSKRKKLITGAILNTYSASCSLMIACSVTIVKNM